MGTRLDYYSEKKKSLNKGYEITKTYAKDGNVVGWDDSAKTLKK